MSTITSRLPATRHREAITVERFLHAVEQRAHKREARGERRSMRYHRSWPLIVHRASDAHGTYSAALHNASRDGIAFLSQMWATPGDRVLIQLFWMNDEHPLVPAVVRHCTPADDGYLVGCEFAVAR